MRAWAARQSFAFKLSNLYFRPQKCKRMRTVAENKLSDGGTLFVNTDNTNMSIALVNEIKTISLNIECLSCRESAERVRALLVVPKRIPKHPQRLSSKTNL